MQKFLFLLAFFYSVNLFSQSITIAATVLDKENNPQEGNIVLLDTLGNMLVGDYFEKGKIVLNTSFKGNGILKVSSLGFVDAELHVVLVNENIDLGIIILNSTANTLSEVVLIANKPMFEKTVDGTKVNVQNSLLSKSANANELLSKIPTLSIVGNKVNVFGRGEALLIMNGKEITMESFKSLPPSDINSIEIITNPDARYDAKGKAVVIITMQKHYSQGTSITLVNNTTVGLIKNKPIGSYTVNAPNFSLNFRKNKWEISTYYGNELGTSWAENNFITSVGNFKKYGYYTENNHNASVHYYRFGVGYKINEKSTLSAQYDGLSHFLKLDVLQNGDFYNESIFASRIRMTNDATTRLQNNSANLNYYNTLNDKGNTLFVGVQYNQFKNKLFDNITELINSTTYHRVNDNLNVIHLYTAQADYSHKLKNGNFDIGMKLSHSTNEGNIQFFSKSAGEVDYTSYQALANKTIYKEYLPAIYAIYKYQWKKLTGSIGARWEHTKASSNSILLKIEYFNQSYSNIFPSAKLQYSLNENSKLVASYNYKINRPLYQDMDPFLWYLDSLTSIRGNAQLKPEYLNQCELRWIFKSFLFRYGYTLSKRTIASVMMANTAAQSPNAVVFTKDNIQQRTLHTVAIEAPFEIGNYSGYNTLAANIYQFKDNRVEYQTLQSKPQLYIYTYHAYRIPKLATVEFTGEFYSSSFDGFTKRSPFYYFTIAISKSFLKNDALNANIMWNDFARTALWAGTFTANTYSNNYKQRFTSDYIRLTLTYNLTSKTHFNYNNRNVNEAEFNRIKK